MLPKIKGHIFILLAFVLCAGMIASPVCAASYTLTGYQEFNILDVQKEYYTSTSNLTFDKSAEDKAITLIHFKVPQDHTVLFTIYYGTGTSASGYATNYGNITVWPLKTTTSEINFDGETKTYSYFDTNPSWDYYLSGYARNNTDNQTGLIVYNAGYGGFDNDLAVFKPVSNLAVNLIYRVDLSSDVPFDADISYGTKSDVAASVSKSILDIAWDWINFGIAISGMVFAFVLMMLGIIKFFFIDNLLLVVALWISVTMAYSAISSSNIFGFYKKFFRYQKALFNFVTQDVWNVLVQIISAFRDIFRI
jgi:hypothetical protein